MRSGTRPATVLWLLLFGLILVSANTGAGNREPPMAIAPSPYEGAPLPRSVDVRIRELLVRQEPRANSRRRGVVVRGSRLPVFESADGPGCSSPWYRVHEHAWVCGDHAVPSDEEPAGARLPVMEQGGLTPWPYAFVREESIEYRAVGRDLRETRELEPGFGFAVAGRIELDGRAFLRTQSGNLVPARAAAVSGRVSTFQGIALYEGTPWPVGWVNRRASAYEEPSRHKRYRIGTVERYDAFEVLEKRGRGMNRFFRFDENAWLWSEDVRVARPATRPDGVADDERWIDVDSATQIITAYEGDTPVYATMVSTGRWGKTATPRGAFPIWVKIAATPMDNTADKPDDDGDDTGTDDAGTPEERHIYSLQDVPWTQFFFEAYGMHGVYWHNRFGHRRSQGCVNLAPRDARWFYDWTLPRLPDGWWAIHTVPEDSPTVVRVR